MKTLALAVCVVAAVLVAGCDKKPDNASSTATSTTAPSGSVAKTAGASEVELDDEDVPVPEDFIEEATKEIDEANFKTKLDEIEKESPSE